MQNELQRGFLKQRKTISCKKSLGKLGSCLFPPESNFQNVVLFAAQYTGVPWLLKVNTELASRSVCTFGPSISRLPLLMQMRWWFRLTSTRPLHVGPSTISQTFAANEIPFSAARADPGSMCLDEWRPWDQAMQIKWRKASLPDSREVKETDYWQPHDS